MLVMSMSVVVMSAVMLRILYFTVVHAIYPCYLIQYNELFIACVVWNMDCVTINPVSPTGLYISSVVML